VFTHKSLGGDFSPNVSSYSPPSQRAGFYDPKLTTLVSVGTIVLSADNSGNLQAVLHWQSLQRFLPPSSPPPVASGRRGSLAILTVFGRWGLASSDNSHSYCLLWVLNTLRGRVETLVFGLLITRTCVTWSLTHRE